MSEAGLDFLGDSLDEIAIEGLDGITLSALWLRLRNRPHFPLALDEKSKEFIWSCIAVHEEISFYELPEPRQPLVLFNRYDHVDMDLGIVTEREEPPYDIYPFCVVDKNGERGSCKTYDVRKNVTLSVKDGFDLKLTLSEVTEKWGEKLVLVASQSARHFALMGTEVNPLLDLNAIHYCILERIGRSRYHGEVTQGKCGLGAMIESVKSLNYYRTTLVRKHLVTKQVHYQKAYNGQTASGCLLHLTRFYVERRSKMHIMMQRMCEILASKPNQREIFHKLRCQLGVRESCYKKLFQKSFQQYVKTSMIPYKQINPNATRRESHTINGKEKLVKVVQLIKPYHEEEEEYDEDEEETNISQLMVFDPKNFIVNRPLLSQTYKIIESAGPEGISSLELGKKLTLPKLDIRLLLRNLEKRGVIMAIMQDVGRQRVSRYISKHLENCSEVCKKLMEESRRILECHPNKSEQKTHLSTGKINQDTSTLSDIQDLQSLEVSTNDSNKLPSIKKSGNGRSFTEEVKYMHDTKRRDTSHITYRILKRANVIIEAVKNEKLIEGVFKLQRMILESEKKEGYDQKLDKKSLLRLLNKLSKDGYIKSLKTVLKFGNQEKKLHFICDPTLSFDDPLFKGAVEQAKFKYFSVSKDQVKKNSLGMDKFINHSVKTLRGLCTKETQQARMEYMPLIGRAYGLEPKFLRMKTLYTFLFYLIYDYQGSILEAAENTELPVYHNSKTWKMFIPPLPKHSGIDRGWCLISDVLLCMPLSLLVKIVNITYKIEGLEEYLSDSVKRHYLIRYIPQHLRNSLLFSRRYIFAVHEVATKLSFMGLLSFGPQQLKEKDQVFIYLHQNTKIKNTSVSQPSYLHISQNVEYTVKDYFLQTLDDVESYWLDLETVCLHTPLGSFNSARGQSITLVNLFRKPEMIEASRNKQFAEVTDDGFMPGDGLGAGGLDSALFSHLKRNWSWPTITNSLHRRSMTRIQKHENEHSIGKSYMQYLLESSTKDPSVERRKRLKRLNKNIGFISSNVQMEDENNLTDATNVLNEPHQHIRRRKRKWLEKKKSAESSELTVTKKSRKPDAIVRTIHRKPFKKRRPYYDDKDKAALKQMSKMRVDWSPQEDSFLLLCKVVSCFLNPTYKAMVVPFTLVRDLLYIKCPDVSKNKTSRACQRRLRYMLLNPTTVSNVSVFLGEIQQDKALVQQFQKPKPPLSNEKVWADMFTIVLEKFLSKFTMCASDRCKKINLPDSLQEFQENYQINISGQLANSESHHAEPQNIDDIHLNVVYSLIIASFCTVGDKTNWSYTLYKLYQQYPENLLRSAVARLRSEQLITKRRDLSKRIIQVVPLSSLPYRLSVTFEIALQTRYQISIYDEANELITKLLENSALVPGIELDGGIDPGYCAAVISLLALHKLNFDIQIPDQIILFDSSLSEEQCSQFVERVKQLQPIDDSTFSTDLAKSMMSDRKDDKYEPPTKKLCKDQNISDKDGKPHLSSECERTGEHSHVEKDLVIGCGNDHSYCSESNENNMSLDVENVPASTIHIELPAPSKASRLALYMLRQEFTQTPTERAQHAQDFFVINSCRIHCRLADKIPNKELKSSSFVYSEMEDPPLETHASSSFGNKLANIFLPRVKIIDIINSMKKFLPFGSVKDAINDLEVVYAKYSSLLVEEGKEILHFINERKELGVTYKEMWCKFQNLSGEMTLDDHLSLMIAHDVILRVGVTCFRYVGIAYHKTWILSSFIIPKEWRSIISELNTEENREEASSKNLSLQSDSLKPVAEQRSTSSSPTPSSVPTVSEITVSSCNLPLSSKGNTCDKDEICQNETSGFALNEKKEENKLAKTRCRRKRLKSFTDETPHSVNTELWPHVAFIGRLWRKPDGSINRPTLQKLLTSVLGYVLTYPGTTEKNVIKHFSKALQPVQTLELLELLIELVCIRKFYTRFSHKSSLFSNVVQINIVSDVKPSDIAHYEPAVDSIIKLGQFIDHLIIKR